jgi:hypothetical protein
VFDRWSAGSCDGSNGGGNLRTMAFGGEDLGASLTCVPFEEKSDFLMSTQSGSGEGLNGLAGR